MLGTHSAQTWLPVVRFSVCFSRRMSLSICDLASGNLGDSVDAHHTGHVASGQGVTSGGAYPTQGDVAVPWQHMALAPPPCEPQRSGGLYPAAPKPAATPTKGLQSSGDSRPAVSHLAQKLVEEVLDWQRRNGFQQIPSKYAGDCEERKLAIRFEKLLLRRDKALGTEPSRSQLSPSEVALVNSVPGVPLHGCSATASCSSSSVAQHFPEPAAIQGPRHAPANCARGADSQKLFPGSVGIHHAADTTDINFEHCQEFLERQQEHIATLKSMLPDVKARHNPILTNVAMGGGYICTLHFVGTL